MAYIDNVAMLAEVIRSKGEDRITDQLARMFMRLVDGIASKPNFNRYSYLNDMKAEALLTLCMKYKNFDETRFSNPFGYFTAVAFTSLVREIKVQKKQQNIRDDMIMALGGTPSLGRQLDDEAEQSGLPLPPKKKRWGGKKAT